MFKLNINPRYVVLILSVFSGAVSVSSQEIDTLLKRFESRFEQLDSLIHTPTRLIAECKGGINSTNLITDFQTVHIDSVIDNQVRAKISESRSATGLSVNGQIYTRLDDGFGLDEDDALSRYKSKVQAELRWNIFGSSLINRKGKSNEIKLRGEITKLDYRRNDLGRRVAFQKEEFHRQYDLLLSGVLAHRIHNLSMLSDALSYLLREGSISSDDLLTIMNEKAEAERLMATIDNVSNETTDLSAPGAVIVTVDTAKLMTFISRYNAETATLELRERLIDQQIANTTYWSTLNVSPFVRYSYYTRPVVSNSSNIDAGVSFIVPISGETSKKRKALKADREVLALERDRLIETITDNIQLTLREIERLNRSIRGEAERLSDLKAYLKLRNRAYTERIGEYNYLARMKEYNSYLLCCERLLAFNYQRDCLLASLQTYLPDVTIIDYCQITAIRSVDKILK